ncbi:TPA: SAM-dependent DNA methyltransferase, partial [Streptococcus agalactiae]|nr:SAM-dependent DNA methyltransferase [Streptococcus agalactiae]
MTLSTEDQVRDYAKEILGFDEIEENINQGTGQITTFNQLGFKEYSDKPDGWYLPKNMNDVAIILETKSEERDISKQIFIDELIKNIDIISSKYK